MASGRYSRAHAEWEHLMAKQPPKRGVKLDLDPILRKRALDVSQSHTPLRYPAGDFSSPDIPSLKALERRGTLQQLLRGIMGRFAQADRKRRDAIDREVVNCMIVGRFLAQDDPIRPRYHSKKWENFWKENSHDPTKALKFAFDEAHADPKRASFYFCSTYRMFEENVRLQDLPCLVTKAGGYQALAARDRRFPRTKRTGLEPKKTPALDDASHENLESSGSNGISVKADNGEIEAPHRKLDAHAKSLLFAATFERGGRQFPDLPAGSYTKAHIQIIEVDQNKRVIKIFHVSNVQRPRRD